MTLELPWRSRASQVRSSEPHSTTGPPEPDRDAVSIRRLRMRAAAPRIGLYALVAILSLAGIRAIVEPASEAAAPPPAVGGAEGNLAAQGFAESFARAYLTWSEEDTEAREKRLERYLTDSTDTEAGFDPGDGTAQDVFWTSVAGSRQVGDRVLVTVTAQTSGGLLYLTVPVGRDSRGLLYVSGYPAFVGPPATAAEQPTRSEEDVDDGSLVTVVERAVENYLAGEVDNLRADLAPGTVVSLPAQPLRMVDTEGVTWVEPDRRVAVEVTAEDGRESSWTLRYELDVEKRDRWYVRSLQVDPTFKEVSG
jgi:hypothetical protein